MVDFQKRDTRRGLRDVGDEREEGEEAAEAPGAETDGEREPAEEESPDEEEHAEETEHDHHAHDVEALGVGVVTVSSSRSLADDPAGDVIVTAFEAADDHVVTRELIRDEFDAVQRTVATLVGRDDVDVVVTTGGTGVTPDDVTVEAVEPLFEKELPGFGELFRLLSYDEIGTKVVATRAVAGVADGVPVFCLPGSEAAARLGTEEIIVEEAGHLAGLATRGEHGHDHEHGHGDDHEHGEGAEGATEETEEPATGSGTPAGSEPLE